MNMENLTVRFEGADYVGTVDCAPVHADCIFRNDETGELLIVIEYTTIVVSKGKGNGVLWV